MTHFASSKSRFALLIGSLWVWSVAAPVVRVEAEDTTIYYLPFEERPKEGESPERGIERLTLVGFRDSERQVHLALIQADRNTTSSSPGTIGVANPVLAALFYREGDSDADWGPLNEFREALRDYKESYLLPSSGARLKLVSVNGSKSMSEIEMSDEEIGAWNQFFREQTARDPFPEATQWIVKQGSKEIVFVAASNAVLDGRSIMENGIISVLVKLEVPRTGPVILGEGGCGGLESLIVDNEWQRFSPGERVERWVARIPRDSADLHLGNLGHSSYVLKNPGLTPVHLGELILVQPGDVRGSRARGETVKGCGSLTIHLDFEGSLNLREGSTADTYDLVVKTDDERRIRLNPKAENSGLRLSLEEADTGPWLTFLLACRDWIADHPWWLVGYLLLCLLCVVLTVYFSRRVSDSPEGDLEGGGSQPTKPDELAPEAFFKIEPGSIQDLETLRVRLLGRFGDQSWFLRVRFFQWARKLREAAKSSVCHFVNQALQGMPPLFEPAEPVEAHKLGQARRREFLRWADRLIEPVDAGEDRSTKDAPLPAQQEPVGPGDATDPLGTGAEPGTAGSDSVEATIGAAVASLEAQVVALQRRLRELEGPPGPQRSLWAEIETLKAEGRARSNELASLKTTVSQAVSSLPESVASVRQELDRRWRELESMLGTPDPSSSLSSLPLVRRIVELERKVVENDEERDRQRGREYSYQELLRAWLNDRGRALAQELGEPAAPAESLLEELHRQQKLEAALSPFYQSGSLLLWRNSPVRAYEQAARALEALAKVAGAELLVETDLAPGELGLVLRGVADRAEEHRRSLLGKAATEGIAQERRVGMELLRGLLDKEAYRALVRLLRLEQVLTAYFQNSEEEAARALWEGADRFLGACKVLRRALSQAGVELDPLCFLKKPAAGWKFQEVSDGRPPILQNSCLYKLVAEQMRAREEDLNGAIGDVSAWGFRCTGMELFAETRGWRCRGWRTL